MNEKAVGLESHGQGALPLIQIISGLVEKRCDKFLTAKYGLTMPQFQLLQAAVRYSGLTLGGLSEQLGCSRGNITGIVDRLERDEWLTRQRSGDDRRVILVKLTEKGHLVGQIEAELEAEMARMATVWDSAQQQALSGMLRRVYEQLRDETAEAG